MSSRKILVVSVKFLESSLEGKDLSDVAKYYRPLLRVEGEHMTSCFFERIGDGNGPMKLGFPYEATIFLNMAEQIEAFFGKPIGDIFPEGSRIELLAGNKVVAQGLSLRVSGAMSTSNGVRLT